MDKGALYRWMVFLLVATGVFMSTMDSSMVNIALPSIMRSFSTTLALTEWVVLMYLLTITVSLLIWGHLADCYGQGRIYIIGMSVFTIGSGVCYFSPFLSFLIFSRFIQGLGAAMMMASGPAIIKSVFPHDQLGRGLGFLGIATSVGLMSGPVISGFLIRYYSWRTIFVVTIPVSLVMFVFGGLFLIKGLPKGNRERTFFFDWYGSTLWILLVSLAVILTGYAKDAGTIVLSVGSICFIFVARMFWKIEKGQRDPLLPILLLRRRYFSIAMATAALSFIVLFIVLILMPFFMDFVLRLPADMIGYVMMAVPLTLFVVSPVSGWLYDNIGAKFLTTAGLALCFYSVILLCFLGPESKPLDIAWRLALLGTGQSLFLSPNTASALARIEKQYTGITSGMLATSRNIGMLLGVALAGMLFGVFFSYFSGGHDLHEFAPYQVGAFVQAFQTTLAGAAVLALVGGIVSVMRE
jgi:EmrB/QacA subfamily drug resistance transporter